MGRRWLAAGTIAVAAGCQAIAGIVDIGLTPAEDGGDGADPVDAADDRGAPDAPGDVVADADAAAVNFLANGDFELGCTSWGTTAGATKAADTVARNGAGSCRVCGPSGGWSFFQEIPAPPPPADLVFEIWVRAPVDAQAAGIVLTEVVVRDDAGAELASHAETGWPAPGETWQGTQTPLAYDAGSAHALTVLVEGTGGDPPPCFLVDDATLSPRR